MKKEGITELLRLSNKILWERTKCINGNGNILQGDNITIGAPMMEE
jgi:hypothetical protein